MHRLNPPKNVVVRSNRCRRNSGWLIDGTKRVPCSLGRSGISALKREGDGATPVGLLPMLRVFYRADRVARPRTRLPVRAITLRDGWCDEPLDRNYNRPVQCPYDASHEPLWRQDGLYDLVVVLDYNISKRVRHKGSAIFMHLRHLDGRPTEGCIALDEADLRRLLRRFGTGDRLLVLPG